ncbi:MAG: hypothetical protein KH328_09685 [Staphylococcus sp.]|nr:hypothetical protein [Staphylococcus sp.]
MYLYSYGDSSYYRLVLLKINRKCYTLSEIANELNEDGHIKTFSSEIDRISLSRTKRNIREICLSNDFEYFVTFTVNSKNADRFSLDECQSLIRKRLKSYQYKISRDLKYILITERHKNGAFHFHGMMKGLRRSDFYINKNGFLSNKMFDKVGFNSFCKIDGNYVRCCNYIIKYITTDCVKNSRNQIYFCSRGLKKADKFDLKIDIPIDFTYENDFVKILDFNSDDFKYKDLVEFLTHYNYSDKL